MNRIERILKHLKDMGYTISEDSGIVCVALRTKNERIIMYHISEHELFSGEYIVERIVTRINELVIEHF